MILASGGIGDLYIVACKLIGTHQKTKQTFELQRYDKYLTYDAPLQKLFNLIDAVTYKGTKPMNELLNDKQHHIYLNVAADGSAFGHFNEPDPPGYPMTPFPKIINKQKRKGHRGIQLHTGKEKGNYKGLPLQLIKQITQQPGTWHLYGTGTGYDQQEIEKICTANNIHNHVNKISFTDWLTEIATLDDYITPEGFSAFFALSHKIPSYIYYVHKEDLRRIHPQWNKYATFEHVSKLPTIKGLLKGKLRLRITANTKVIAWIKKAHPKGRGIY